MSKTGEIKVTTNWVLVVTFRPGARPWLAKKFKRSAGAEDKALRWAAKNGIRLLD